MEWQAVLIREQCADHLEYITYLEEQKEKAYDEYLGICRRLEQEMSRYKDCLQTLNQMSCESKLPTREGATQSMAYQS